VLDAINCAIEENIISEDSLTVENVKGFLSDYRKAFYKVNKRKDEKILVKRVKNADSPGTLKREDVDIYLFRDSLVNWSIEWI
jgi:dihydroorotase